MIRNTIAALIFLLTQSLAAQDDLMKLITDADSGEITFTLATFKSTRIMNGHSVQRMPPGQLDFRVSHRFGLVNSGLYEFFGLDQSNAHFSFEYGILPWLMVGAGRGTYEKAYDGFAKFTLLRQSTGAREIPVSISAFSSMAITSVRWADPERTNYFSSRLSYVHQLLVARKFNQSLSFQLTPSFVHRNLVVTRDEPNDLFSVGAGGRVLLSRRISLNAEYFYLVNRKGSQGQSFYDPLSIGVDIETGGHVFQLIFTNSLAMIEKGFIGETTGRWKEGDIHFGFNISRVFTIRR
jgi:hypothetical protein